MTNFNLRMLTSIAMLVFQTIPCEDDAQSRWRLCRVLACLVEVPQHRHPRTPTGQTYGKTLFLIICNCNLSTLLLNLYNSEPQNSCYKTTTRLCVQYWLKTSMKVINFSTITWPVNDDGENNFCLFVLPLPVSASCLSYSFVHLISPSWSSCQYINEHSESSCCNNVTVHIFSTFLLRKNLYLG
jgi:hypothetical protein